MKLISMTAFVLEQINTPYTDSEKLRVIKNYAKFLKQPLKLEMFVPCDEGEPFNYSKHGNSEQYEKAIEKVLFESNDEFLINTSNSLTKDMTIEDLIKYNLTLTENATKQFL